MYRTGIYWYYFYSPELHFRRFKCESDAIEWALKYVDDEKMRDAIVNRIDYTNEREYTYVRINRDNIVIHLDEERIILCSDECTSFKNKA